MITGSVIGKAYRGYWSVGGRSNRREYFAFLVYVVGVTAGLMLTERLIYGQATPPRFSLASTFFFLNLIPLIAVFVRRLHDADEDIPLMLVPIWVLILGAIGLMANFGLATLFALIFVPFGQLLCLKVLKDPGTTGGNRFGADTDTPDDVHWHEHLALQDARTRAVYRVRRD